jgi:hypothetical protein
MRVCSIEGCNKKHYAKGYCQTHYIYFKRTGNPIFIPNKTKKCIICDKLRYAKEYCRNHYVDYLRNGKLIYTKEIKKILYPNKICLVKNCKNKAKIKGLCVKHRQSQLLYGYSIKDMEINHLKGKYNINWNGGVQQYPNHRLMQKNRLIKLESINYICEECGDKATEVHHKDKTKINHDIENLIGLCHKCHMSVYHSQKHKSKCRELFGMTLKEMSNKYDKSIQVLSYHIKKNDLKKYLNKKGILI